MKKGLVVLLIAVLALSAVFADVAITGKFVGAYTFDFDSAEQYYTPSNKSTFKLTLAGDTKSFTGDGSVYADVSASVNIWYDSASYWKSGVNYVWSNKKDSAENAIRADLSLDKVEIVGEKWSLDLIHTLYKANYATDGFDSVTCVVPAHKKNYKATYGYSQGIASSNTKVPGVIFTYDGFKVSGAYNNEDGTKTILVAAESKEFDFNGLKAKAFVGYSKGSTGTGATDYVFEASAKASYSADDVAVSAATDFAVVDDEVKYDVSANASYAPVTFDFYFAKEATLSYTNKKDESVKVATVENFMSMKAVVALGDVIENVPVTLTATAKDVLNDAAVYSVKANTTAVENFDITVYFNDFTNAKKVGGDVEYTGIENVDLSAGAYYGIEGKYFGANASAEYTAEKFTATADAGIYKAEDADMLYGVELGVSTDKIVAGATLAADFVYDVDGALVDSWNTGKYLEVSCTIEW